jgi:hypothetical protein
MLHHHLKLKQYQRVSGFFMPMFSGGFDAVFSGLTPSFTPTSFFMGSKLGS